MKSFLQYIELKEAYYRPKITQKVEKVMRWMAQVDKLENSIDYDLTSSRKITRIEAQIERAINMMSDNELAQCGLWDDIEHRKEVRAQQAEDEQEAQNPQ